MAAAFALSVRSAIVEPRAAAATADNIRASATLFRVSFVVDLTANLVYLLTAVALYLLFRHVQELVAAAMVTFVAVSVAVGSFGPDLARGDLSTWWVYLVGPVAGAVIAVGVARVLRGPATAEEARAAVGTLLDRSV